MSDEATSLPMWERPINEQVSVIRHDLQGTDGKVVLLHGVYDKLVRRVEGIEDRQTLMEAHIANLPVTTELMEASIERVMERRAESNRAERAREWNERKRTVIKWGAGFAVVMSTGVPIIDKVGHWLGLW